MMVMQKTTTTMGSFTARSFGVKSKLPLFSPMPSSHHLERLFTETEGEVECVCVVVLVLDGFESTRRDQIAIDN